jgi:hypothetical protein
MLVSLLVTRNGLQLVQGMRPLWLRLMLSWHPFGTSSSTVGIAVCARGFNLAGTTVLAIFMVWLSLSNASLHVVLARKKLVLLVPILFC